MVWGLGSQPTGNYYPDFQALDGDMGNIECEDMTPDGGKDIRKGECTDAGRRLKAENVPTKIEWRSKSKVPDLTSPYIAMAVTERFRQVVEDLEPNVHQFLPLQYVDRKGEPLAQRWYFIPCNRIDSVDRKHTTMILYKGAIWVPYDSIERVYPDDPVLQNVDKEKKPDLSLARNKRQVIISGGTSILVSAVCF